MKALIVAGILAAGTVFTGCETRSDYRYGRSSHGYHDSSPRYYSQSRVIRHQDRHYDRGRDYDHRVARTGRSAGYAADRTVGFAGRTAGRTVVSTGRTVGRVTDATFGNVGRGVSRTFGARDPNWDRDRDRNWDRNRDGDRRGGRYDSRGRRVID